VDDETLDLIEKILHELILKTEAGPKRDNLTCASLFIRAARGKTPDTTTAKTYIYDFEGVVQHLRQELTKFGSQAEQLGELLEHVMEEIRTLVRGHTDGDRDSDGADGSN